MEFLDPHYKRKHGRLLFIGYGLIAGIIAIVTVLLVLQASGYDVTRRGEVVVNSLLFVDSHPNGAEVYLDGQAQGEQTDARLVVPEGEYTLSIRADGYVPWQKRVTLEGRRVEFAKYPFLFPESLQTSVVKNYEDTIATSQSLDRKWLLAHNTLDNSYDLYDLDNDNLAATANAFNKLPEDIELAEAKIEILEWADDNRTLLLQVVQQDEIRYFLYKLRSSEAPAEIVPAAEPVKDMRLNDRKDEEVYIWYESGLLTRYNVAEEQASVISLGVLAFETYDSDIILFATTNRDKTAVDVVFSDDLVEYKLQELTLGPNAIYSLALARFDGDFIVAVGSNLDERMTVYEDPLELLQDNEELVVLSRPRVEGLRELKFSQNTRFVAGLVDNGFVLYDAEEAQPLRFDMRGLASDYEISWMDGHRLYARIEGLLRIFEFDGNNARKFEAVDPGESVFFDKNYDNLYFLTSGTEISSIKQTKLIVEDN